MSEDWLKCDISEGMFSDERAVTYGDMSVFVPEDSVDNEAVKVMTFEDEGGIFAVLPTSDRAIIAVKKSDLRGK
ncbi:MAG: hypothetical protein WD768_00725 [Phycisphaeraceae bacterium]